MASDKAGTKPKGGYSKRVQRLRKIIIGTVIASCLIPTCICVILAVRYDILKGNYEQTQANLDWYRSRFGVEKDILAREESVEAELPENRQASNTDASFDVDYASVEVSGAQNPENIEGTRYVYLTFDDGPSSNTNEILDILAEYNVKATFFVCGKPDSRYTDVYKRMVDEGHTLGMHSYSHKYSVIYESVDSFKEDLMKLRIFLYQTTGEMSSFYRFPGGSSNDVSTVDMKDLIAYLNESDITFFDWNVSAGDDRAGADKTTIYNNIVNNVPRFQHCVILMHDSADKHATVEALPEIIEAIQAMDDTVIDPITDDTLPVQHIK